MSLQKDLENSVQGLFKNYSQSPLTLPNNKGNLYELYLYLLIYQSLARVSNTRIINPGGGFRFRCSPGKINNRTFSYVSFTKNNRSYELRNGIEVIGINMFHEMDIIIFRGRQQDNNRPSRNQRNIIWAIECKNHSKLNSLKGEVRKFLGAITDLSLIDHGSAGCIHCGVGFVPYFATPLNAKTTHRYRVYLNNYGLNPLFNLKPNSSEEQDFINSVIDLYNGL